jgi:hypothetical protein
MSGIIGDNVGRSGGLIKSASVSAGWNLLTTSTATGSEVTLLEIGSAYITSTYDTYVIVIDGLTLTSDNTGLAMLFTEDSGSSYHTATDWRFYIIESATDQGGNSVQSHSTAGETPITIGGAGHNLGNATGEGFSGQIWLHNMLNTQLNTQVSYHSVYTAPDDTAVTALGGGEVNDVVALNGFKIYSIAGDGWDYGTIKLFGI